MEIMSRKDAIAGLYRSYYTGSPCKRGHLSLRRTSDSMCRECIKSLLDRPGWREASRIRSGQWYEQNKERASIRAKEYRSRKKSELSENSAKYRAANKERITQIQANYRAAKKEELSRKGKEAYSIIGGRRWVNISFKAAKKRALKCGLPFDDEAVLQCLRNPPTHCPIFGIKFEVGKGQQMRWDASATLDRIRPSLGYVRGNIAVISWRANRIKSDASSMELRAIADWIDSITKPSIAAVA